MSHLSRLKPEAVWNFFDEITKIPRASKKEEKIIRYITGFAEKHMLSHAKDKTGNVIIRKPAAKGYENRKKICLQSHLDMVCEKVNASNHNFDKDPIQTYIDGDWVRADGTTLGADNGIGIAAQLALLADPELEHGPVECLFTVDEETGLFGAFGLESGFFESRILLNLDSEDEGEIFIGSAGGVNTTATITYNVRNTPEPSKAYRLEVSGLQGGHSGTDIHKNRGNSIKILNQILWEIRNRFGARLSVFEGGNLHNAIPREAYAVVVVPGMYVEVFLDYFQEYSKRLMVEHVIDEPALKLTASQAELPGKVLKKKVQEKLLNALYVCPNGVISWSRVIENLVETSTNLASIKFKPENQIIIATSQRSSSNSERQLIANSVRSTFRLAGAKVDHTGGYPGWNPNPGSEILGVAVSSYTNLFGKKPAVKAIHAGLECGLFLEKYPDLDMISFGPTILDAHSPSERVSIETTVKFWDLLLDILKNVPEEQHPDGV
ncbi:MAG: aminoacyl-histidine dipeptidase [Bacteroidales bacterium]|nr:aminoacyl-histidine dipeptidase [Bacteroidales bacterium]